MRVAVDAGSYHRAVEALRAGNELGAQHYGSLTRKLDGYAGMSGDDCTSEDFARSYDTAAQEAVDGLADVVDSFATLCGLVAQSHDNHRRADAASVFGHPAPDTDVFDFQPGTVDVGPMRLSSSLGANDADLPVLWNEVLDHLEGFAWPNADTARLRAAASSWRSAADDVEHLTSCCRSAISWLESQDSPEVPLATQAVRELRRAVLDVASALRSVGDACDEFAATVEEHRAVVEGILADLAVEAGLTLAAGAVVGFFTVGGGAAAGAAISGWRIVTAARKVLATLRALEALAKARAVARLETVVSRVRPVRRVLERLKSGKRLRTGGKSVKPADNGPHHKPRQAGDPLDPTARPPTAGAGWEGRVADNGKGDVWQLPGAEGNRYSIRIMEPTTRYPNGYVKFIDGENQPLNLLGKPGSKAGMHIPINPDGSFPVPKGWNP